MIKTKEITVKNILTPCRIKGFDYTINSYIGCTHKCIYCYAEYIKMFTNHTEEWGDFLDIKICDKAFTHKKLHNKSIIMSTATDPYNHYEAKYQKTKQILEELISLQDNGTEFTLMILTKSPMILRDIELLKKVKSLRIGISLNTTDDSFRELSEPMTPSVSARIKAIKTLSQEGLAVDLFVSPIFPYLTDISSLYKHLKNDVAEWSFENLNLRGAYKKRVLDMIQKHYPQFYNSYKIIYAKREDNIVFWDEIKHKIEEHFVNVPHVIRFYHQTATK